jgi:6-phosphogluconolactonase
MHCGIGADTHTASLFPGDPRIHDRTGIAATVYVPKLSQWRVTLLPGPIVNAAHTAVLAAGNDKAEAVRSVFTEQYAPIRYPAQLNCRLSAFWFLDAAAARFLRQ